MLMLVAPEAQGHPISITWVDAHVTKTKARITLKITPEDLYLFYNIEPDENNLLKAKDLLDALEKHEAFLLKYFFVLDIQGKRMEGKIIKISPFKIEGQGVPMSEIAGKTATYVLLFDLDEPPNILTFYQNFGGDEMTLPAVMVMSVTQGSFDQTIRSELDKGMPYIVRFSWDGQTPPQVASRESLRDEDVPDIEKAMGISSYSSIYSFIYITDYEVRHEILIPLLTLETWFTISRKKPDILEIDEQDVAYVMLSDFFSKHNQIEIDGIVVQPTVQRIDFYGLDFKDFAMQAERRAVRPVTARVGAILSYSTKGTPSKVKIAWDMNNWRVHFMRSVIYAYDQNLKHVFCHPTPNFEWTNPGRDPLPSITKITSPAPPPKLAIPIAALACLPALILVMIIMKAASCKKGHYITAILVLGILTATAWPYGRLEVPDPFTPPPTVSDQEALAIFESLHKNIYRAFDYRTESDVYDALANSVDGDLLADIYLKIRKGLEMQEQGGAVSRVKEVKIVDGKKTMLNETDNENNYDFGYQCNWTVEGTVEHWGHIHTRVNQYEAMFSVRTREDAWKITDMQVLNEKRLKFQTRLRKM